MSYTKSAKIEVFYSPKSVISAIELDSVKLINKHISESDFMYSVFINKYRKCIETIAHYSQFACEANSFEDYQKEKSDLPNSITFLFDNSIKSKFKFCPISVFKFHDECGTPDIPLHSRYEIHKNVITFGSEISGKYESGKYKYSRN